jgi:small neutral amino acid transporter SnatA (MarC family)
MENLQNLKAANSREEQKGEWKHRKVCLKSLYINFSILNIFYFFDKILLYLFYKI